jgi:long-chain acyl-CoA synthetase
MHLGEAFHQAALRRPEKTALICGTDAVTYREMDRAVDALAHWFAQQGLERGDRVAIHSRNSIEAIELFFACFRAGLIAVPVNWRMKALEVAYVLDHCSARLCFTQPALEHVVSEAGPACAVLTDLPALPDSGPAFPNPDDHDPAVLLYTSGTIARPRGVTHTHRSMNGSAALMRELGFHEDVVFLQATSVMHASGIICAVVPFMTSGATMVLLPAFDAAAALDAIERHRCTVAAALPTMAQFLVEEQAARPRDVSSLARAYAGGDSVAPNLQERFQTLFGVPLLELYGMTESVPACSNSCGASRRGSMGRPLGGVEVRVLDLSGKDVNDGETGELALRSPANFAGYWDDPRETAAALQDGWLLTGDLARRDPDGYYWFEGRKKQIIIRGGSNIAPQEVEEALYHHPAVLEAGVIGMPDPVYGERVVAFVSLRSPVTEEELRQFARTRLADYKVPERIRFLPELPKGITGKVQRRDLKEMAVSA